MILEVSICDVTFGGNDVTFGGDSYEMIFSSFNVTTYKYSHA